MRSKKVIILILVLFLVILGLNLWGSRLRPEPKPAIDIGYGLHWYGRNQASQKVEPGVPNPYYDPSKPVLIFVHGWMPNQAGTPPTLQFAYNDVERDVAYDIDLAEAWLEDGWNVGFFYWHPFADEDAVWDAEDKIWTAESENGMRWRDAEGMFHSESMPEQSASELFFAAYVVALEDFAGDEIRIAGHSLGNQMATLLTKQLIEGVEANEVDAKLLPARLTLLDPFWSPFDKPYLEGERTGTVLRRYILDEVLTRGIAVEWIRSSLLTEVSELGEFTPELQKAGSTLELTPNFCTSVDQTCRHDAAWQLYLLSYGEPAPQECLAAPGSDVCGPTGEHIPLAHTSTADLLSMMAYPYDWVQVIGPEEGDGRITPTTADDWFTRVEIEEEE